MKLLKKILFVYNLVLILSLFIQGVRQLKSFPDLVLIILVTAPAMYFFIPILFKLRFNEVVKNKLVIFFNLLKTISLVNTSILFFIALLGLVFHFEYIFVLLILPLPLYFLMGDLIAQKDQEEIIKPIEKIVKVPVMPAQVAIKDRKTPINDPLRRQFIKIIGGSGLGLLIASLINPKKAEASFFGSVPGPGTVAVKDSSNNKIDPAIKSPTDAYGITQIDDSSPSYYGFVNKEGAWYITCEESDGSYRYSKGDENFSTNWTNRSSLSYDYYNLTF